MIMVRHLDDSVDVEATDEQWHCPITSLQPVFLMIPAILIKSTILINSRLPKKAPIGLDWWFYVQLLPIIHTSAALF